MNPVDPERLDLAREFRQCPNGPHSADLQKLLMRLRWDCATEQFVVVQLVTAGPWYLARMNGPRGCPLEIYRECPLATADDAAWAVFRKRWEVRTGQALVLAEDGLPDPTATAPVSSVGLVDRPLLGYSDRISVANGERIGFKVSAARGGDYEAHIVRLRCGDHANLAFRQQPVGAAVDGTYPGRVQPVHAGSWITVPGLAMPPGPITLHAFVWPTAPTLGLGRGLGEQALLGWWDQAAGAGFALFIDAQGCVCAQVGDGVSQHRVATGIQVLERHWYEVGASFDPVASATSIDLAGGLSARKTSDRSGVLWVGQRALRRYPRVDSTAEASAVVAVGVPYTASGAEQQFRIAACVASLDTANNFGQPVATAHYNGKLEAPTVATRALGAAERAAFMAADFRGFASEDLAARWDFSREMSGTRIVDVSGRQLHGETVNLPTRAMKGVRWDGSEYNFQHAPSHYGAIHFHDDDLYDCGWLTDFEWSVPAELPSGLYCAQLRQSAPGGEGEVSEDWVPFVVRPPPGTARAPLALLLPTAAYWAYANRNTLIAYEGREHVRAGFTAADPTAVYLHHHPELGLSTYDNHSDGSGVCYSSRLRPVLSIRPGEALWQLPADTHIIDWLEAKGIEFDVITEDDLDAEGVTLLERYRCVMTGTHPEYPSKAMIDAYEAYQQQGGRFIYMGGNGFYWRVSYHPELPGVLEMRRAEDGIRAWLAEGGEYYHGFTGELGGMWRRMGHAPQRVAGTGMTAQGFDMSTGYRRTEQSFDPRAAFIFAGVGADEVIGDFGIIGGGAAGSEIDRADVSLGTPPHALVVAVADTFSSSYHWMKEELTHTHAAITGDTCPHVHCDMVFYETTNGGAVFSTSSIAWAGALAHNDYQNNVSRITENVVRRFLSPDPL